MGQSAMRVACAYGSCAGRARVDARRATVCSLGAAAGRRRLGDARAPARGEGMPILGSLAIAGLAARAMMMMLMKGVRLRSNCDGVCNT